MRLGNWLSADQSQALWQAPDRGRLKGKRDQALLAVLPACGLRRHELAGLTVDHLQQREGHWAIVDLRGKAGHVRTIPVPDWVQSLLDEWTKAAGIATGSLFRRVSSAGKVWGERVTENSSGTSSKSSLPRSVSASSRRMISVEAAAAFVEPRAASWIRFSSCLVTFPCRRPNATLAARSVFHRRSTTASGSSRKPERYLRKSGRRSTQISRWRIQARFLVPIRRNSRERGSDTEYDFQIARNPRRPRR